MLRPLYFAVLTWIGTACLGEERQGLQEAPRFRPAHALVPSTNGALKSEPQRVPGSSRQQESASPGEARRWLDSTGRYKTHAALVSRTHDSVTLRRTDGVVVRVPIHRLSAADVEYLKQIDHAPTTNVAPLPADLVYVQVSARMLQRFLSRPVARQSAINDTIVGTPVRGTAGMHGVIDLRLIPMNRRAAVDLVFQGQVLSQTTGFGGPVRVHSSGVTSFSAIKRLMFDEKGIEVLPARVAAQTATAIQDVSTHLPRLRGWIARRIGSRRAAELAPAAEAEAARKAESRIAAQFDLEIVNQLQNARTKWSGALAKLPMDGRLIAGSVRFATTVDYLHLAIHQTEGKPSTIRPPAPSVVGSPDLAIHVHSSLVDRVVRDTDLQRLLEPFVNALLAEKMQRLVGIVPIEPRIELKKSSDGTWWSLVVRELRSSGM